MKKVSWIIALFVVLFVLIYGGLHSFKKGTPVEEPLVDSNIPEQKMATAVPVKKSLPATPMFKGVVVNGETVSLSHTFNLFKLPGHEVKLTRILNDHTFEIEYRDTLTASGGTGSPDKGACTESTGNKYKVQITNSSPSECLSTNTCDSSTTFCFSNVSAKGEMLFVDAKTQ